MTEKASLYIRNFVFGVEDSLVSTGGVITGVALAGVGKEIILLTGFVVIFVEAFSMGAGSFLSERSVRGYTKDSEGKFEKSLAGGGVMFTAYFLAGFIPLLPYLIWDLSTAIPISVIVSLVALFMLGIVIARVSKMNMLREGITMIVVGGIAMLLGRIAGMIIN